MKFDDPQPTAAVIEPTALCAGTDALDQMPSFLSENHEESLAPDSEA